MPSSLRLLLFVEEQFGRVLFTPNCSFCGSMERLLSQDTKSCAVQSLQVSATASAASASNGNHSLVSSMIAKMPTAEELCKARVVKSRT